VTVINLSPQERALNERDFTKNASGHLVKTAKGFFSFVPNPLPPTFQYDSSIVMGLSRADTALAELSAFGTRLPNPHLLIHPYIRREAVLSSKIEGTQTRLSDLLLGEVEEQHPKPNDDTREVQNYVRALELGLSKLKQIPLSLRLVKDLHTTLMRGVRGANKTPGEFRQGQNIVGPQGSTEQTAAYVPPPAPQMLHALGDWEKYLHNRDEMPELIQCALLHVQFESIHPFWDGNGRVGRLLIPIFLIERKKLSQPLLYVSAFFEEHRRDYYDLLQRTRTDGDWRSWILFFLEGVGKIAADAAKQSRELMDLRESYRIKLHGKPRAIALIDRLFINPYVTAFSAARDMKVSFPTASKAIQDLVAAQILRELTGRRRDRVYYAGEVFDLVAPPDERNRSVAERTAVYATTKA
jgi:Fic family protein